MWQLRIQHADGTIDTVPLESDRALRFGSGSKADIRLVGDGIRSVHLGIVPRDGELYAVAAKAVRFIKHNDKLVSKAKLALGDRFVLGEVVLEVVSPSSSSGAADKSSLSEGLEPLEPLETLEPAHALDELPPLDELDDPSREELTPLESPELGGAGLESSLADWGDLEGEVEETSPFGLEPAARSPAPQRSRGLSPRTHRLLQAGGLAVLFAVTSAAIWFWPLEVPPPVSQARLLKEGKWEELASQSRSYVERYRLSPFRAEVAAWEQLARWQLTFRRDGLSSELANQIRAGLADERAAFWEPAVRNPLDHLLQRAIADGMEEATVQLRRRNDDRGLAALKRTEVLLEVASRLFGRSTSATRRIDERWIEIAELRRRLERPAQLADSLESIREAGQASDIEAVFGHYDAIVSSFPEVESNATLQGAVGRIVERYSEQWRAETPGESLSELSGDESVERVARSAPTTTPLYPLVAADGDTALLVNRLGHVVLRRDRGPSSAMLRGVSLPSGGAVLLLADPPGIVAYDGSGKRIWGRALPGQPVDGRNEEGDLLIATSAGMVCLLDGRTGEPKSRFELGITMASAGVLDETRDVYWIVTGRGVLGGLDLKSGRCVRAIYTGHRPGSVTLPPCLLGDLVVLADRTGVGTHRIRAWQVEDGALMAETTFPGLIVAWAESRSGALIGLDASGRTFRLKSTSGGQELELTTSSIDWHRRDRLASAKRGGEYWIAGRTLRRLSWPAAATRPTVVTELMLGSEVVGGPVELGTRTFWLVRGEADVEVWKVTTQGVATRIEQSATGTPNRAAGGIR